MVTEVKDQRSITQRTTNGGQTKKMQQTQKQKKTTRSKYNASTYRFEQSLQPDCQSRPQVAGPVGTYLADSTQYLRSHQVDHLNLRQNITR